MGTAEFPVVSLAEALERLAGMPPFLEKALAGRTAEALRIRTEAGGEFSLVEQACHLRDLEREGYLHRLHRMLIEDTPELPGFEGGEIARMRNYQAQDAHAAACDFARCRAALVAGLAALDPPQLQRTARFGGRLISVADLASMVVDHDRGHREELQRLVASLPAP
ncbi:hypothetical protein DSM104443_02944 [Usitatibacter rugosus]|uniref:DinB-like domain-containing protein n=1 Tax=Usitatibacter rugosus TaxID=2732067 RepID=A0A6M4GX55_9PROT|nr:DinB family protein [Usitatibacter rugosus]QJR11861.1 hypothetical protein DSM104443_02944 [Usitatibacter rugosus]